MFFNKKNKIRDSVFLLILIFSFSINRVDALDHSIETRKMVIVGGGHLGLIEACLASLRAHKNGQELQIEIFEKNQKIEETTAANIWNSHTPDEIVSVVPRGQELRQKLEIPFDQPGGIRVNDVPGVNDSECAHHFIDQVILYGQNEKGNEKRTEVLLKLGKAGTALWKQLYETADEELRAIFEESNFNPCCEPADKEKENLHQGYRIDVIYGVPHAVNRAKDMMSSYQKLGYKNCQILSPDDVVARDPSLGQFCSAHSVGESGKRQWKEDSVALWRPGGCLDTQKFLPLLVDYLTKTRGADFQLRFNKKVVGVIYDSNAPGQVMIKGLKFADGTQTENNPNLTTYVFCPGEAVGTLKKLGFKEPAYAGFAGASLCLDVPISDEQLKKFEGFNHCMEVHGVGIVLAWQARIRDGKIFLGGAGTKSFYADKEPTISEAFATNRNLLQLRMFNDVLPWVVSIALNRDTAGQQLTEKDMAFLEEKKIAKRWVGRRSVAYDGFPTLGHLYHNNKVVSNGRVTTHAGSGGGSFSLITSLISSFALYPEETREELKRLGMSLDFAQEVLRYGDSRRHATSSG